MWLNNQQIKEKSIRERFEKRSMFPVKRMYSFLSKNR